MSSRREKREQSVIDMDLVPSGKDLRPYSCPECPEAYQDKNLLKRHLAVHKVSDLQKECASGTLEGREGQEIFSTLSELEEGGGQREKIKGRMNNDEGGMPVQKKRKRRAMWKLGKETKRKRRQVDGSREVVKNRNEKKTEVEKEVGQGQQQTKLDEEVAENEKPRMKLMKVASVGGSRLINVEKLDESLYLKDYEEGRNNRMEVSASEYNSESSEFVLHWSDSSLSTTIWISDEESEVEELWLTDDESELCSNGIVANAACSELNDSAAPVGVGLQMDIEDSVEPVVIDISREGPEEAPSQLEEEGSVRPDTGSQCEDNKSGLPDNKQEDGVDSRKMRFAEALVSLVRTQRRRNRYVAMVNEYRKKGWVELEKNVKTFDNIY